MYSALSFGKSIFPAIHLHPGSARSASTASTCLSIAGTKRVSSKLKARPPGLFQRNGAAVAVAVASCMPAMP